jgi:hypothetical protein
MYILRCCLGVNLIMIFEFRGSAGRRMRWAGHVACMGEDRSVHRVLVGKPEGRRPAIGET